MGRPVWKLKPAHRTSWHFSSKMHFPTVSVEGLWAHGCSVPSVSFSLQQRRCCQRWESGRSVSQLLILQCGARLPVGGCTLDASAPGLELGLGVSCSVIILPGQGQGCRSYPSLWYSMNVCIIALRQTMAMSGIQRNIILELKSKL